jgi:hypothetical protein
MEMDRLTKTPIIENEDTNKGADRARYTAYLQRICRTALENDAKPKEQGKRRGKA